MFIIQIVTNLLLFLIGVAGIVSNRDNVLTILMCIEMVLLSVNLNLILISVYLDDFLGQIFSLFLLTVAAAESALGLAILILYYHKKKNENSFLLSDKATLKG